MAEPMQNNISELKVKLVDVMCKASKQFSNSLSHKGLLYQFSYLSIRLKHMSLCSCETETKSESQPNQQQKCTQFYFKIRNSANSYFVRNISISTATLVTKQQDIDENASDPTRVLFFTFTGLVNGFVALPPAARPKAVMENKAIRSTGTLLFTQAPCL